MSITSKQKAIRNIVLSLAFLLVLLVVSIVAKDLVGVAMGFAVVIGLPSLLLSVADLERALKIEHAGNDNATTATRLLSHFRAAGGAICIAAVGYTLFRNVSALVIGSSAEPVALQLAWVVSGVLFTFLGFKLIVQAFAKESNESNDT
jgi:hypothetical protein